jgi:pseudouridine synthase
MPYIRLQKFLSLAGICSRRKGEEHIAAGRIKINGRTVTELGIKIDPEKDRIEFQGKKIEAKEKMVYIALNKPEGYVSSCSQKKEKIVLDLLKNIKERVYPVGRLDKNSTGLLLLTNDGHLHQKLSHPSFDHEKEYEVVLEKAILNNDLEKFASGIMISGKKTRPAAVKRVKKKHFIIVLKEGRNRQIRRMAEKVENKVVGLKRIRISNIRLGKLKTGSWRYLTKEEVRVLKDF